MTPKSPKRRQKTSQNQLLLNYFDSFSTPFWTFRAQGPRGPGNSFQALFLSLWAGRGFPDCPADLEPTQANQTKNWPIRESIRESMGSLLTSGCFPWRNKENSQKPVLFTKETPLTRKSTRESANFFGLVCLGGFQATPEKIQETASSRVYSERGFECVSKLAMSL